VSHITNKYAFSCYYIKEYLYIYISNKICRSINKASATSIIKCIATKKIEKRRVKNT